MCKLARRYGSMDRSITWVCRWVSVPETSCRRASTWTLRCDSPSRVRNLSCMVWFLAVFAFRRCGCAALRRGFLGCCGSSGVGCGFARVLQVLRIVFCRPLPRSIPNPRGAPRGKAQYTVDARFSGTTRVAALDWRERAPAVISDASGESRDLLIPAKRALAGFAWGVARTAY